MSRSRWRARSLTAVASRRERIKALCARARTLVAIGAHTHSLSHTHLGHDRVGRRGRTVGEDPPHVPHLPGIRSHSVSPLPVRRRRRRAMAGDAPARRNGAWARPRSASASARRRRFEQPSDFPPPPVRSAREAAGWRGTGVSRRRGRASKPLSLIT